MFDAASPNAGAMEEHRFIKTVGRAAEAICRKNSLANFDYRLPFDCVAGGGICRADARFNRKSGASSALIRSV